MNKGRKRTLGEKNKWCDKAQGRFVPGLEGTWCFGSDGLSQIAETLLLSSVHRAAFKKVHTLFLTKNKIRCLYLKKVLPK